MKWIKKGHIFKPSTKNEWMQSHSQCPTALVLKDRIRVYFSTRTEDQQSTIFFIDLDKKNPKKIISLSSEPILKLGRKGTFDENGLISNCLVKKNGQIYLYYSGWSRCKNVPYKNFTGLAISDDKGLSFKKYGEAPVFSMNKYDPLSATGPCIIKRDGDYIAIYSTGTEWVEVGEKLEHTYLLTYAISKDAINWKGTGEIIIKPEREFMAHCLPAIIFIDGIYHMWFSTRGSYTFREAGEDAYRLGYASSKDLIHWNRDDANVGIDVSAKGWDSEMLCYPNIVKVNDKYIMFYNGNGFGKSGFGYAELQNSV